MDNETRINRVIAALEAASGEEDDLVSNIIDLLTDLMHLCRQQEIAFQGCLTVAEVNFEQRNRKAPAAFPPTCLQRSFPCPIPTFHF